MIRNILNEAISKEYSKYFTTSEQCANCDGASLDHRLIKYRKYIYICTTICITNNLRCITEYLLSVNKIRVSLRTFINFILNVSLSLLFPN